MTCTCPGRRLILNDARRTKASRDPGVVLRLPNARHAVVPLEKLQAYLLASDHPTGAAKARTFAALGYRVENAKQLGAALGCIAEAHDVQQVLSTSYGTKYVLEGYLDGVNSRRAWIRSVWIAETGMPAPRLVTAYPVKRPT